MLVGGHPGFVVDKDRNYGTQILLPFPVLRMVINVNYKCETQ